MTSRASKREWSFKKHSTTESQSQSLLQKRKKRYSLKCLKRRINMKNKNICKNCRQPIFKYDGEWWHDGGNNGYDKCINFPINDYAEPIEEIK